MFGQELRYVVAIQRVGRGDTGVLAITAFAEIPPTDRDTKPVPLLHPTADDAVTLVYSDAADDRWPDVTELVDRTLTAAVTGFAGTLG